MLLIASPFSFFATVQLAPSILLTTTISYAKFINVPHRLPAYFAAVEIATYVEKKLPSSQIWNSFLSDWIGSNVSLEELASGKRH